MSNPEYIDPLDYPRTADGFWQYWLDRCDTDEWYRMAVNIQRARLTRHEWEEAAQVTLSKDDDEPLEQLMERFEQLIEENPMHVFFSIMDEEWEPEEYEERPFLDKCVQEFASAHNLPVTHYINQGAFAAQSVWFTDWSRERDIYDS